MRKLRNLFSLVLLFCLVALTGGSLAGVADIVQATSEWRCRCGDECYGCPYDVDNDCVINIVDIMTVASRWGCQCSDECYEALYDFDADCEIGLPDIMAVASRWRCGCGDACYDCTIWQPSGITPWQLQFTDLPVDQSYDVVMYDIDLFDNDASVVASLHAQGRVVIAYFSAGSWEDWRPDADDFPDSVKGANNGWPGEKWLDIRQLDVLGPIMEARMDLAVQKGFDGLEPDNVDGYDNNTGFTITYDDQIAYNIFLANAAHQRGLSICLKNDLGQVVDLEPYFDWALNEECYNYSECDELLPFIDAGKAVMHVEYDRPTSAFCPWSNAHNFSSMKKRLDLDAWMDPCW